MKNSKFEIPGTLNPSGFTCRNPKLKTGNGESESRRVGESRRFALSLVHCFIVLLSLSILFCQPSTVLGQGTEFTYQGRLNDGLNAVSGIYDLRFTIYDSSGGGSAVAGPLTNSPTVSNGLFTVTLDFGAGVFNGADRWLEIGARTNGGGGFTTLSPRQKITATPYATYSGGANASGLVGTIPSSALTGTYSSPLTLNNGANSFSGSFYGQFFGLSFIGGSFSGAFIGDGSGLANLNASQVSGTLPVATLGNAWKTTGNTGAGNFLGTVDTQPVELRVNNTAALRLQYTVAGEGPNIIAGSPNNIAFGGARGATIGGGGSTADPNGISAHYATISGGHGNNVYAEGGTIGGGYANANSDTNGTIAGGVFNSLDGSPSGSLSSTIGGGFNNHVGVSQAGTIAGGIQNHIYGNSGVAFVGGGYQNFIETNGFNGTIAGGYFNLLTAGYATIGGGSFNRLTATYGTIGGGNLNTNSGDYATIPGGSQNRASGDYSFAAGRQAKAEHDGAFVWADSQNAPHRSTTNNQFLIRAQGGVGINTNNPQAALHVGGDLAANALRAPGAGTNTGTFAFVHRAVGTNTGGNTTTIYNPLTDGDPGAVVIITHNWTADTNSVTKYNTTPVGVYYSGGRWAIFNEDASSMGLGRAFNVMIIKP